MLPKLQHRLRRKRRIRSRIHGTLERPRMSVYRSLRGMYVQLIDDAAGKTLVSASLKEINATLTTEGATKLGKLIADKAKKAKIGTVIFDRSGYKYHGRVKALADAAREGGLEF
ncbi:MAG TPA: 50S ribosomal protein L18 [Candidatus Peribacterales bacterium]|nr:50S ribosomal protein L18 [Candidatus Peribacterales bacterium]